MRSARSSKWAKVRRASGQLRAGRRGLLGQEGRGVRRRWDDRSDRHDDRRGGGRDDGAGESAATTSAPEGTTETTAAEGAAASSTSPPRRSHRPRASRSRAGDSSSPATPRSAAVDARQRGMRLLLPDAHPHVHRAAPRYRQQPRVPSRTSPRASSRTRTTRSGRSSCVKASTSRMARRSTPTPRSTTSTAPSSG